MIIRQEENTPIGDYFHDSGIKKVFSKLEENVDEFEVDTDDLISWCDSLSELAKGLKACIKRTEAAWSKIKRQEELNQ